MPHSYPLCSHSRFFIIATTLALSACGGGSDGSPSNTSNTSNTSSNANTPSQLAPSRIQLSANSVLEGKQGVVIGTLSTNSTANEVVNFLVNDTRFEIIGNQLKLKANQLLNYSQTAHIALTITATNKYGSTTTSFSLQVKDDPNFPITTKTPVVRNHPTFGKYVDVRDFGADVTGVKDSFPAIERALAMAHQEKAALYFGIGTFFVSQQIKIDTQTQGVTALFGESMDKSKITFNWQQTGVHNPESNQTDSRSFAGILIDGQHNKTIANLAVQYQHKQATDFYRAGDSYFGRVNGILVSDANYTTIDGVEVSGANRSGVLFSSSKGYNEKPKLTKGTHTYTSSDLHYGGIGNKLINSYLHHNRVSGVMGAYQKDLTVRNNRLAYNGHEKDGGTGYGLSLMAGSYNYNISITHNTTNHNYRKGLDSHDGNKLLIANNTLNGDRLYSIAVENRQFTMDDVIIRGNTINPDATFVLAKDDNDNISATSAAGYASYWGIRIENKQQPWQDFPNPKNANFIIQNNTINGLADGAGLTRAIEFRNHEWEADYTLTIDKNTIKGASADNIAFIRGESPKYVKGTGTINITTNTIDITRIPDTLIDIGEIGTYPHLHGAINFTGNRITMGNNPGVPRLLTVSSNAKTITIANNPTLNLTGYIGNNPTITLRNIANTPASANIHTNHFYSKSHSPLNTSWFFVHNINLSTHQNQNTLQ